MLNLKQLLGLSNEKKEKFIPQCSIISKPFNLNQVNVEDIIQMTFTKEKIEDMKKKGIEQFNEPDTYILDEFQAKGWIDFCFYLYETVLKDRSGKTVNALYIESIYHVLYTSNENLNPLLCGIFPTENPNPLLYGIRPTEKQCILLLLTEHEGEVYFEGHPQGIKIAHISREIGTSNFTTHYLPYYYENIDIPCCKVN